MKRWLVVVFLLAGSLAFAQSSVWRLSRNGQSLYLGGSIHLLREGDYPLPPEFDAAFNQADMLVLETDINEFNSPEVVAQIQKQMLLPPEESLNTLLSKGVYKKLARRCEEMGIPVELLARYKPAAAMNLLGSVQTREYGFTVQGVDLHYFFRAQTEAKKFGFLEPLAVQIEVLTGTGAGFADDFVLYSLNDMDKSGELLEVLVAEWKAGLGNQLEAELSAMKEGYPLVYKTVFLNRNAAWLPLIEAYLETPEVEFIIVGVGHFYGPGGLFGELQRRGCTLEQIRAGEESPLPGDPTAGLR